MKNAGYILLLCASCSTVKHGTENSRVQKALSVSAFRRKDSLGWQGSGSSVRFLQNDQLDIMEIIPVGRFTYHPDTGFSGEAAQVRVFRQSAGRSLAKDTLSVSTTGIRNIAAADSSSYEQAQQQKEVLKQPVPIPWYPYLVAVFIVAGLFFGYRLFAFYRASRK